LQLSFRSLPGVDDLLSPRFAFFFPFFFFPFTFSSLVIVYSLRRHGVSWGKLLPYHIRLPSMV
jgi:hypothetical protein